MPLPWEEYQQPQQRLPWQDFQPPSAAQQASADMSAITTSLDNVPAGNPIRDAQAARNVAAYDNAPWYRKAPVALSDELQLLAHGGSFGLADKAAAYLRSAIGGKSYEDERAKIDNQVQGARDRAGWAGTAAELAGGAKTASQIAGNGLTMAGRFGTAAMEGVPGVLARAGLMVPEGAAYGTVSAYGNDQDLGTGALIGAAAGGAGSLAGDAIAAGTNKVAGLFNKKPTIPSMDEISALKSAAYDRADQAGVAYTPDAMAKLQGNIVKTFADRAFLPANEPGAAAVLQKINELQGQNVTLKGLDAIRKMAGNAYIPGNKSNNALTAEIVNQIDALVSKPSANDVLMGNAQAGWAALSEARALASREIKMEKIADAIQKADLRAASTGSGGNVDNATRQNLRRVLEKPRGFTPDERTALETAVRGTPTQNALRLAGKLSPSGNGLMAALGIGGTMVNPMVGLASLGGMGAKTIADSMTNQNVQQVLNTIAAGGTKSATQAAPNAVQRLADAEREPLARLLMSLGVNVGGAFANTPSQ
ncbi:MAG: hypothetical protein E5X05_01320 [Mesorhizobium sp.]|nr:MAG: hypothetical protein E5X05_01320 [Mesorhizobium sp.]